MRMSRRRKTNFFHRKKVAKKNGEGSAYVEYSEASKVVGEVWPANGKVQAEMYGTDLSYIRNVKIEGDYKLIPDEKGVIHYVFGNGVDIVEKDGLCLYTDEESKPDYEIISIKPYNPLRLEAKHL